MIDNGEVAFVIPALNEGKLIGSTIASIRRHAGENVDIVVVDNGSIDNTVDVVQSLGARCYLIPGASIAALRNFGAIKTNASTLVFVDADVQLTQEWEAEIPRALSQLKRNEKIVTGSRCSPPPEDNWFLRNWFLPIAEASSSDYIGTGHMIVTRKLFDELSGFDKCLVTGEDYDFCQRARIGGAAIVNNNKLKVIHFDFPMSAFDFVKREMWHGLGDLVNFRVLALSKVAVASAIFFCLHLLVGVALFMGSPMWILFSGLICLLCILAAVKKFKGYGSKILIINTLNYYLYFFGRSASFFYAIYKKFK